MFFVDVSLYLEDDFDRRTGEGTYQITVMKGEPNGQKPEPVLLHLDKEELTELQVSIAQALGKDSAVFTI